MNGVIEQYDIIDEKHAIHLSISHLVPANLIKHPRSYLQFCSKDVNLKLTTPF